MKCPICDVLMSSYERDDVEIATCPECGRVFVDECELDEIPDPIYAEPEEPRTHLGPGLMRQPRTRPIDPARLPSDAFIG